MRRRRNESKDKDKGLEAKHHDAKCMYLFLMDKKESLTEDERPRQDSGGNDENEFKIRYL